MSFPSGGGSQRTSTVTSRELSPEQQEFLALALPRAREFVETPPTLFPSTAVAGFDPLQVQAQEQVLQAAAGPVAQLGQTGAEAQQLLLGPNLQAATLGQLLLLPRLLDPQQNPALQQAISGAIRPLEQSLTQQALPAIRGGAIEAGQFGGSRQGIAEGIATQSFLQQSGDIAAALSNRAFESGQETAAQLIRGGLAEAVRALVTLPQISQLPFAPAGAVEAVGTQRRALEQARLSEEAEKFLAEQILPFAAATEAAQLAFGAGGGTTRTAGTVAGGGVDPLSAVLGLVSLFAGFGGFGLFGGGGPSPLQLSGPF